MIDSSPHFAYFQDRKLISPVIFTPKKFVPKTESDQSNSILKSNTGYESTDESRIKPKWTPSGVEGTGEPAYRKIRPNFDARNSLERSAMPTTKTTTAATSLFKKVPQDQAVKVGQEVRHIPTKLNSIK